MTNGFRLSGSTIAMKIVGGTARMKVKNMKRKSGSAMNLDLINDI